MAQNKNIRLLNISSEIGAGTRGASKSLEGLKLAAIKRESSIFKTHKIIKVKDENNSLQKNINFPNAKRIKAIYEVLNRVSSCVKKELLKNNFPVLISGDHSISIGTIAGIKSAFKNQTIGVVWIDAHADIHSPYTTPSGNMHGMPVAASLGIDNILPKGNHPHTEAIKLWDSIKSLGDICPKLNPENIVYIGVRDTEWQENELIDKLGIKNYTVDFIRDNGAILTAKMALENLADCDLIYVSFDVDVLDTSISEGTGTPVANGLFLTELKSLIFEFSKSEKLCCFEIVEINPIIDNKGNSMAEIGLDILEILIQSIKITS
tara:strand:- start:7243 stop:8205 length:963 start_codon:yes stop_codon:yes gene_type:complete